MIDNLILFKRKPDNTSNKAAGVDHFGQPQDNNSNLDSSYYDNSSDSDSNSSDSDQDKRDARNARRRERYQERLAEARHERRAELKRRREHARY